MSELAVDGIPVTVSLRVLKLSRQPYYRWRKQQVTQAELIEAYRANALLDAHRDDPEYGYRLLIDQQRTANKNALTALLRTTDVGIDARKPLTDVQIATIAAWRTGRDEPSQRVFREEARRLAKSIIEQTRSLQQNHQALSVPSGSAGTCQTTRKLPTRSGFTHVL